MSSSTKITINTYPASSFDVAFWNLKSEGEYREPERISIRRGDKEYSIVFDTDTKLEVWSLDDNKELNHLLETKFFEQSEIEPDPFLD